jgi:hypothetical protein
MIASFSCNITIPTTISPFQLYLPHSNIATIFGIALTNHSTNLKDIQNSLPDDDDDDDDYNYIIIIITISSSSSSSADHSDRAV